MDRASKISTTPHLNFCVKKLQLCPETIISNPAMLVGAITDYYNESIRIRPEVGQIDLGKFLRARAGLTISEIAYAEYDEPNELAKFCAQLPNLSLVARLYEDFNLAIRYGDYPTSFVKQYGINIPPCY